MSNGMGIFVGMVFLGILVLMTINYGQSMMASTDQGVNLTGTAYATTYSNSTQSVQATMSFNKILIWTVALAALVAGLFLVLSSAKNNNYM